MELQWPLIVFTTLVAWSAGLFGTQALMAAFGVGKKAQVPAWIASAVLLAVGGIAVFFHLEHWERIFNGFGHLTSGITQELIAIVVLAAVAVARAIRHHGLTDCGIKWPNDILVKGRKMVGILTELNGSAEKVNYIIMGIGVNTGITAEDLSKDLQPIVTSFAREGVRVSRLALLETLLKEIEGLDQTVCRDGFAPVLAEWRALSCMLGQDVTVTSIDKTFSGKAVDIDENGNLLVATPEGVEVVMAGDIHVRPA